MFVLKQTHTTNWKYKMWLLMWTVMCH